MMNIIHVEGALSGMQKIKDILKVTQQYYKYDMLIFKQDKMLTELTGNIEPTLLYEMVMLSY